MLFYSYQFLFLFFPLAIMASWLALSFVGDKAQKLVMLAGSLAFYGYWDVRFLALLIGSILVNFSLGNLLWTWRRREWQQSAGWLLAAGVTANLMAIGVFKYANFFIGNVNALTGTDYVLRRIVLPLGISFFTFEQISFLVDVKRGHSQPSGLLDYALFVSFFPRVVAGPILRFQEIVPQLRRQDRAPAIADQLMVGLTIFFIGLAKKTILADGIAPYATSMFHTAEHGASLDFFAAWAGALAYTCQLYFDFSGYSDMAIGAARCFGIRFPMNFFSPYKSTSIIEFWRRWHITLSRFLRDYLYIGLGGNRRGTTRRYLNLMLTMLLGGLWHGANWTFVLWGGLHGCYLMINHAWVAAADRVALLARFRRSHAGAATGWVLTFLAVVVGWVFFRSPDLRTALHILDGMIGGNGFVLPAGLAYALEPVHKVVAALGVTFDVDRSGTEFVKGYLWIGALLTIAFLAPNTQQLMRDWDPVLDLPQPGREPAAGLALQLIWRPSRGWALAIGSLALVGTIAITRVSEFLYWQF